MAQWHPRELSKRGGGITSLARRQHHYRRELITQIDACSVFAGAMISDHYSARLLSLAAGWALACEKKVPHRIVTARGKSGESVLRSHGVIKNSMDDMRRSQAIQIALARAFGATDIVSERGDASIERVREPTGGLGAHSVLECVGHGEATRTAVSIARHEHRRCPRCLPRDERPRSHQSDDRVLR
jgi:hypothetical protein